MKVLLYTEGLKTISKSGLGKAIKHQMKALEDNKIEYTTNLKDDFDILHINFWGPKSYWFAKKAKKNGKKIVYHAHSTEEDFRNSFLFSNLMAPLFKKWLIKCYKLGDQIVTPTEYSKMLLENYNMDRPIKAISNGVEVKFFERNEEAGAEFRKQYGYKKSDKVIVGIGLYIERKGIIDFVELARRLPQYKFIWFGYSPLWASPRKIKKAVNTKLPNLHFAGYVDSSIIKAALSGANLYLFPTHEETEGIPIIEALTSKIPTLIRDIPVFSEYPADKVVYKAKDIDEFEKKIPLIIEKKLPNITEKGYKAAKKKDLKTVGKELIATYEETLKMKPKKQLKQKKKKTTDKNKTKKNNKIWNYSILVGSIALIVFALFASDKIFKKTLTEYKRTVFYMDTAIEIKIYTSSKTKAEKALDGVEDIYKTYHQLTNKYDKNSQLYYIHNNTSSEATLVIDPILYEMLEYGIEWYTKSKGLFNINIGNVTDVWYKYRDLGSGIPTKKELDEAGSIDITDIVLLGNNTIKNTRPNIDLGSLSKGYATQKASEYLIKQGITSYMINAGGHIMVGDYHNIDTPLSFADENSLPKNKKTSYYIGIESPFREDHSQFLTVVQATNKVISTSGSYNRFYEYEGKTYGHIIDPKTRVPAEHMISVTVIADDSILADVLSTTLFLMPIPEGIEYIKNFEGVHAIWAYVDSEGNNKKVMTENFYGLK